MIVALEKTHGLNSASRHLVTRHGVVRIGQRSALMGVLNVTPDSFYDGGRRPTSEQAITDGVDMAAAGADIIDIGGESTRPGARLVSEDEELERVLPVIQGLRRAVSVPISIDTYKANVARAALDVGADIVNDISALRFDGAMAALVAKENVPVVLMHMQGTPQTMQTDPRYSDLLREVQDFLRAQVRFAERSGIAPEKIIVDPGIGFGKKIEHNLQLLNHLSELATLGYPLLVGASRKAFIGRILDVAPEARMEGSLAAAVAAVLAGADIIRAHDVRETRRAMDVADAIRHATGAEASSHG